MSGFEASAALAYLDEIGTHSTGQRAACLNLQNPLQEPTLMCALDFAAGAACKRVCGCGGDYR